MPWTSGHEVLLHFVYNVGRLGFHSFLLLPFASQSNSLAGLEIYAHSVHSLDSGRDGEISFINWSSTSSIKPGLLEK